MKAKGRGGCNKGCLGALLVTMSVLGYLQVTYRVWEVNLKYTAEDQHTQRGIVGAVLTGTMHEAEYLVITNAPYKLFIWMEPANTDVTQVDINSVTIQTKDGKNVYSEKVKRGLTRQKSEDGYVGIEIGGIALPEEDLVLKLEMNIVSMEEVAPVDVEFIFRFNTRRTYFNAIWGPFIS